MQVNSNTLDKIQKLGHIYHDGYSNEMANTILDKLISLEYEYALRDLTDIGSRLKLFESKYRMLSDEFYEQFKNGSLGDHADFFEWSAYYDMYLSVTNRLNILKIQERHE